jgi:hypothetical protein
MPSLVSAFFIEEIYWNEKAFTKKKPSRKTKKINLKTSVDKNSYYNI